MLSARLTLSFGPTLTCRTNLGGVAAEDFTDGATLDDTPDDGPDDVIGLEADGDVCE